jgi:hypothetical protein
MDKLTTVINCETRLETESGLGQSLLNYCKNICKITITQDFPPQCNCKLSKWYYAMVKKGDRKNWGFSVEEYNETISSLSVKEEIVSCDMCGLTYRGTYHLKIHFCLNCGNEMKD